MTKSMYYIKIGTWFLQSINMNGPNQRRLSLTPVLGEECFYNQFPKDDYKSLAQMHIPFSVLTRDIEYKDTVLSLESCEEELFRGMPTDKQDGSES